MSLAAFHAGLKAQLTSDTALKAWAQGHFKRNLTAIDGNREIDTITAEESPALLFEIGAGDSAPEVGGYRQHVDGAMQTAVAWYEADPARALAQRVALVDLMIAAVLRNPDLSDAVDGAWVSRYEPVRGGRPFMHVMRFQVSGEFNVIV